MENSAPAADGPSPCQACGACCAYSSNWPRFTIEDDAALDLIPAKLVNDRLSGMRCNGDRCAAIRNARWRGDGTGWRSCKPWMLFERLGRIYSGHPRLDHSP